VRAVEAIAIALGLGAIAYAITKSSEAKPSGAGGFIPIPIPQGGISLPEIKFPEIKLPDITLPGINVVQSYPTTPEVPIEIRQIAKELQNKAKVPTVSLQEVAKQIFEYGKTGTWKVKIGDKIATITAKKPDIKFKIPKPEFPKAEDLIPKAEDLPKPKDLINQLIEPWRKELNELWNQIKHWNAEAAKALVPNVWHWHPIPVASGPVIKHNPATGTGGGRVIHTGYKLGGRSWSFRIGPGFVAGL